jgi:hypothetical protein
MAEPTDLSVAVQAAVRRRRRPERLLNAVGRGDVALVLGVLYVGSSMGPGNDEQVARAARHWNERFAGEASSTRQVEQYALASELYQRLALGAHFAEGGGDWLDGVRLKVAPHGPVPRALVLGCGVGGSLVDLHRRGLAAALHGVDVSIEAVQSSRDHARAAGLAGRVTFRLGDFHRLGLAPDPRRARPPF